MSRSIFTAAVFVLFILTVAVPAAVAADSISLDPSVIRLTMQPGETWRGAVRVTNGADRAATFTTGTANFAYSDDVEVPALNEELVSRIGTLAAWVQPGVPTFTLAAQESGVLYFSLVIPNNAAPGTHRGLLTFTRSPDVPLGNALGTSTAVALGIELTVVGQPNHHLAIGESILSPRVGTKPPVGILTTIVNSGNTLPTMRVSATVHRVWGKGVTVPMTPDSGSTKVAPGSASLWRGSWDGSGFVPIGLFRVRIVATDSAGVYEDSRWLLLVPWQVLAGVIVALAVILGGRRLWPRTVRRRRA